MTSTQTWFGGFDAFCSTTSLSPEGACGHWSTIAFLGMFAVITPALISGAVADRMKFAAWAIFAPVWMLLVFAPVFKWVYGGWLGVRGSLDFAGGTAIHVNAGIAALVAVLILGKRKGWPEQGSSAALDAAGHDRYRDPLVRLVRLQRRLGARRERVRPCRRS